MDQHELLARIAQVGDEGGTTLDLSEEEIDDLPPEIGSLTAAYLSGADPVNLIPGANLTEAVLELADLEGADLGHAILTGADLSGANLHEANLDGVIGADFTGAFNVPPEYL